jgi:hypothetical protein
VAHLFSGLARRLHGAATARMARQPTYSAFYQKDHSRIIYRHKPDDGTLAHLPDDAAPADDPRSTYFRQDGGDPFEFALFKTSGDLLIVVQKDGHAPIRRAKQ